MLLTFGALVTWVAVAAAVCAICAAGGAADQQSEEWYAAHQEATELVALQAADDQERGAA